MGRVNLCPEDKIKLIFNIKKVSKYDNEKPQSHTADQPLHREEDPQNINCKKTSKHNKSKATSFLFLVKWIAKLERK